MNHSPHTLAVEGGAMRRIFATGVLDAFLAAQYQTFNRSLFMQIGIKASSAIPIA